MFASLAIGLYLLGLVLRNQQLVTVAVVLLSFLTYAAFRTTHADVASSGRRLEDNESDEGIQLGGISALRKVSSSRVFEDGEIDVVLRIQNRTPMAKIIEVRDRVPEVMRIKKGANYVLMELGGRRETEISYTVEAPLRGFYTIGPVCVRIQDTFGLFHNEREIQLYDDFLVFPKMEDIKDAMIKSKVPKIFTGAVNIRNPGEGSNFYNLREYIPGDPMKKVNWNATARSGGKMMVNEYERDAVSDIILIVDSRSMSETGPVSRNSLVYSTRAAASLAQHFLARRDSVGLVTYGDEIVSVDRDTGKKQLYVILTKLAGAVAKGNTPLRVVTNRLMPHINRGSPIIILSPLEDDPTIIDAVRDLRARNFMVTILSPSSIDFEFDARRLDPVGYELLKTERDILMTEIRGLGANIMDWEPEMLLVTALAGARGY
ncbi:MAG: DUF58 domain-containing protein [Candidatus Thalassarchaeaceae archaeon]|jgi:uncharacterized protein (DUF58 family)|nr:DUF58 domain-containing protein [Candidatus Thalassarchaeaceae archaeon]